MWLLNTDWLCVCRCCLCLQLKFELQQVKAADTARSMARALQWELNYWRREKTTQRTRSNGTQWVSRSWLQQA